RTLLRFRPRHFRPVSGIQLGLTDPVCGLIMGKTAEILAQDFGIFRQEQDEFALESHRRASAAQKRCDLAGEITPVPAARCGMVSDHATTSVEVKQDVGPRVDQTLEALAKLKPFFKEGGTVTVGNSCPL